jgi:D-alanyl-D-alanine carboxypeptidase (penicillin-binding protein 5/6)
MKRFLSSVFLFLFTITNLHAQPLKCTINAKSAILYNPDTGAILFSKEPDLLRHPGSIMKIATALYVLEGKKMDLRTECLVSKEAMVTINAALKHANFDAYPPHILEHDGVSTGIKAGEVYSLESLLHGMLLWSGNDTSNVIAEVCSGSIGKFVEELNQFLRAKGMTKTKFSNPHGLHHPDQVTTAYEMAQISAMAFNNPTFAKILKTHSYEAENSKKFINKVVKVCKYTYPKSLGGKLGYTSDAGRNFVAAAEDNGRRLIVVLLGCASKDDQFKEAMTLFETAFREQKKERLLFPMEHERFVREIPRASRPLKARLVQDVKISYFPSEEKQLKARLVWNQLELPIAAGAQVGRILVEDEAGKSIVDAPLFAETGLKKSVIYKILDLAKWIAIIGSILFALVVGFKLVKKNQKN